jgi:hypothetical protein
MNSTCESCHLAIGRDTDRLPGRTVTGRRGLWRSAHGESAALHGCRRGNQFAVSLSLPAVGQNWSVLEPGPDAVATADRALVTAHEAMPSPWCTCSRGDAGLVKCVLDGSGVRDHLLRTMRGRRMHAVTVQCRLQQRWVSHRTILSGARAWGQPTRMAFRLDDNPHLDR